MDLDNKNIVGTYGNVHCRFNMYAWHPYSGNNYYLKPNPDFFKFDGYKNIDTNNINMSNNVILRRFIVWWAAAIFASETPHLDFLRVMY